MKVKDVLAKVVEVLKTVGKVLYRALRWSVVNLFKVLPTEWKLMILEDYNGVKK